MRVVLGAITPDRSVEDPTFLIDDILNLIETRDTDEDVMDQLMNTFTANELERLATHIMGSSPPPQREKKTHNAQATTANSHIRAYSKVRYMR